MLRIGETSYDLYFSIRAPGRDGMDISLRSIPTTRRLPVIMITAYGTVEMRCAPMQSPARQLRTKPLGQHEKLLADVRAALAGAGPGRRKRSSLKRALDAAALATTPGHMLERSEPMLKISTGRAGGQQSLTSVAARRERDGQGSHATACHLNSQRRAGRSFR